MRSSPWRTFAGISLIALGTLFLLRQTGLVDAGEIVWRMWPLAIVLFGLLQLWASPARPVVPAIIVVGGLVLLSTTLGLVPHSALASLWPLALIAAGAWILFNRASLVRHSGGKLDVLASLTRRAGDDLDIVDSFVIFGSVGARSRSPRFRGGSAVAMFGEVKLDLRDAQPDSDRTTLDATAFFGAIVIRVPRDWRVEVGGAPVFGVINNQATAEGSLSEDAPTLRVDALATCGEVKIEY